MVIAFRLRGVSISIQIVDQNKRKINDAAERYFQTPEMLKQDPARLYPRAETRLVNVGEGDAGCGMRMVCIKT